MSATDKQMANETAAESTMRTLDLTPTPAEYVRIAARFGHSILGDVKAKRREDSAKLLASIVEIAVFLGTQDNAQDLREGLLNLLKPLGVRS